MSEGTVNGRGGLAEEVPEGARLTVECAETVPTDHSGDEPDRQVRGRTGITRSIGARRIPILVTAVSLVTGLAFMFLWDPVVYHHQQWAIGGDAWGIWRAAHYVGWGDLGGVYTPGTGVVSLPGMAVILAPLAMLSGWLGLTDTNGAFILSHPTAALLMQPAEILLSSTVVFAADAVTERLGAGSRRRVAVCLVVGLLAWPVGVLWGHAEDTLAVAIAMYALLAADDRRWPACGWLFGAAITVQPLVALLLPMVVAISPAGQRLRTLGRMLVLPVFLVAVAFAGDAADTWRAIVQQPTPPATNHATPWTALAPVVERWKTAGGRVSKAVVDASGEFTVRITHVRAVTGIEVSGGPGRFVYFALALAAGLFVWRRPQSALRLFWVAALVLGARCLFEAVMTPYYLAPPLILALVVASRSEARRFWAASAVAVATSVFAYLRFGPWVWWLPVVAGSAVVLALAYPTRAVVAESVGDSVHEAEAPMPSDVGNPVDPASAELAPTA